MFGVVLFLVNTKITGKKTKNQAQDKKPGSNKANKN